MLEGNMSDEKKYIKKWTSISFSRSATKFVISPLELKTATFIDLLLSDGEITTLNFVFLPTRKSKKSKKNSLKKTVRNI